MVAPSSTVTPGPNTTLGSTVTSRPSLVSAARNTVSGAIKVTPASMAAARSRCCSTASASASCALVLMPRTSSSVGFDRDRLQAHVAGDGDRVGEIVFALGIGIADALEHGRARDAPANAISPPLQKPMLRSSAVASFSSRMAISSLPRSEQPAVTVGIRRAETEHRHAPRRRRAPRATWQASPARTSGVSPNITRMSSAPCAMASRAISTACAVPRVRAARSICACGAQRARLARHRLVVGPDHHGDLAAARRAGGRQAHARAACGPPSRCSAFGKAERMRVPSPAASTMARQVRRLIRFCVRSGPSATAVLG